MANSTCLDHDADPCHVLWQVNQIGAQALRLTRMVQPAENTGGLRTRMAEFRTNAIDTYLSAGLIHLPDEPARGLRPVSAPMLATDLIHLPLKGTGVLTAKCLTQ